MIGRRVDNLYSPNPPTAEPGDYGFSNAGRLWVKPPGVRVPSQSVAEERVVRHWKWGFLWSDKISVRGVLVWYRGLGDDRTIVWAGFLTRGVWRELNPHEYKRFCDDLEIASKPADGGS